MKFKPILHFKLQKIWMTNIKISKQIKTGYPLALRWYAKLVSGLAGLEVARHFLNVTNFVKICHFDAKT